MPHIEEKKHKFAKSLSAERCEDTSMLYDALNAAAAPGTNEKYLPLIFQAIKLPVVAVKKVVVGQKPKQKSLGEVPETTNGKPKIVQLTRR